MFTVPNEFRLKVSDAERLSKIWKNTTKERLIGLAEVSLTKKNDNEGIFVLPNPRSMKGMFLYCLASTGEGWNHVKVNIPSLDRTPTWEEMNFVRFAFWGLEDPVFMFFQTKSEFLPNPLHYLHLWEPNQGQPIVRPPKSLFN